MGNKRNNNKVKCRKEREREALEGTNVGNQ